MRWTRWLDCPFKSYPFKSRPFNGPPVEVIVRLLVTRFKVVCLIVRPLKGRSVDVSSRWYDPDELSSD